MISPQENVSPLYSGSMAVDTSASLARREQCTPAVAPTVMLKH